MAGFRDFQSAIQARAQRGDGGRRVPFDVEQIRALFSRLVTETWTPAEIETLRRAASSGLL